MLRRLAPRHHAPPGAATRTRGSTRAAGRPRVRRSPTRARRGTRGSSRMARSRSSRAPSTRSRPSTRGDTTTMTPRDATHMISGKWECPRSRPSRRGDTTMVSCEWHTSGSRLSRHRRSDAALVRDRRLFAGSTQQQRARVPRRHAALRDVRVAGGGLRLRPGRIFARRALLLDVAHALRRHARGRLVAEALPHGPALETPALDARTRRLYETPAQGVGARRLR